MGRFFTPNGGYRIFWISYFKAWPGKKRENPTKPTNNLQNCPFSNRERALGHCQPSTTGKLIFSIFRISSKFSRFSPPASAVEFLSNSCRIPVEFLSNSCGILIEAPPFFVQGPAIFCTNFAQAHKPSKTHDFPLGADFFDFGNLAKPENPTENRQEADRKKSFSPYLAFF